MIDKLQRRFILICAISVLSVVTLIFGVILVWNISSLNKNMDFLADRVSEGGGKFPETYKDDRPPDNKPPKKKHHFDFFTPETPFSTRYFTVFFDAHGKVSETYTDSIFSITEDLAIEYAHTALESGNDRGWISSYRYKLFSAETGNYVVFVDGSMNGSAMMQSIAIAGAVLFACATFVLVLIFLLSKSAVKPIAESYEKQKQFITDANHELKTPLTLILANLDIAESELGKSEWLDDIRSEGQRMTELINQLVSLSRMDEENHTLTLSTVALGNIVSNTVLEFESLALSRGKKLSASIDDGLTYQGDEALLRRLIGILMDNAIKYCDYDGEISVTLRRGRHIVLSVENTYRAVKELELNRLFDRFYRADKSRTFTGGYGIGLSLAKAIVEKHKSEITAYKIGETHIGFKVVLHNLK